jgi:hypothetical protein
MDQALKEALAGGGYAVDPYAVAVAMLDSGRAPIPLNPPVRPRLDMLVSPEIVDGYASGADQDQPTALEGTA